MTALNAILADRRRENKIVNYPTFNEKSDKDINDFIIKLKKVFTVNRVFDNRKHLVAVSCLKEMTTNFYNRLAGIIE